MTDALEQAHAELVSLRAQLRREQDARAEAHKHSEVLAGVVGIDPREPSPQPLLVEVTYHVRNTMESHRRLAHDVVQLTRELDEERAQHRANIEGFESALATVEYEKALLEAEGMKLRAERDQARRELVAAMQTIEAATAALGGPRAKEQCEQPGELVEVDRG